jgi:formate hydrogenlyase subunit 3/multisubunit Na+/H+ antiporter MnhD subunit
MRVVRWLALLPPCAVLVGPFFINRVTPFVFGFPLFLAWLIGWVVLTSAIMGVIFYFDPDNAGEGR